jgi:hypothetical protein
MDFKKLIADLATRYRKLTEPISSSSLAPSGQVVDVDARLLLALTVSAETIHSRQLSGAFRIAWISNPMPKLSYFRRLEGNQSTPGALNEDDDHGQ